MFRKNKSICVKEVVFTENLKSHSSTSKSNNLSTEELYKYIKSLRNNHGKLIIESISESNEIHISTLSTKQYELQNDKLEEISELIEDYVEGNAVKVKAYSVISGNETIGIYTKEIKAKVKQNQLIRQGCENVEIKEIIIE